MSITSVAKALPATSPFVLCEEKLASFSVPSHFKDALDDVRTFLELSSTYHDKCDIRRAVRLKVLQACHDRLLNSVQKLLEPPAIQDEEMGALCEVVAKAALVLATFRSTLVSDHDSGASVRLKR